ncbi:MAG: type II toxin-antitoxin system VapC family toxin [Anaerolineae bacterium]|nr:type II toxin-antitoxin system VapC family toxin [Promineifilum sp.]MCZ2114590.1 type II toxin-antitoxin system VapC family toxin [Anaerolineae bacterium]
MTDYLLDSNHASPLVTLSHPLRSRILEELNRGHTFAITVPVLTETLFGLYMLPSLERSIAEWSRLRQAIPCYRVDENDAEMAAGLQAMLRKRGWQLETADALIAATVLRYDLILLTTDKDFSAIPDLKRENWLV